MTPFDSRSPLVIVLTVSFSFAGPVLFPPTRTDTNNGGVVVGASGYGFVPPGGQRGKNFQLFTKASTLPLYLPLSTRHKLSHKASSLPQFKQEGLM